MASGPRRASPHRAGPRARRRARSCTPSAGIRLSLTHRLAELIADLLERAPVRGHLKWAGWRRHRLRGEARVPEQDLHSDELARLRRLVEPGVRIARAPVIDAVEL